MSRGGIRTGRRRPPGPGQDPLGWMFTFSDVVTLVFTFFVMMLAVRQPELVKYRAAFGDLAGAPSPAAVTATTPPPPEGLPVERPTPDRPAGQLKPAPPVAVGEQVAAPVPEETKGTSSETAAELDLPGGPGGLPSGALQSGLNLREDPRGTVITLANDLLFAPGSSELPPAAHAEIHKVAALLGPGRQAISVEGHTDDTPLAAGKAFRDNWELSLARAVAVARRLIDQEGLAPARLRVAALAGSRPLINNDSPEHRAMNRRTEIVILKPGG
ncbi:MAG: flagellar motor protein MotB [Pseudomonadota bacterium]